MNKLAVNFSSVCNIKDYYEAGLVVDAIDYPIISDADTVISAIPQFLAAGRPGVILQVNKLWGNTFPQRYRQLFKLRLRAGSYFNFIGHYALCVLRSSFKKLLRLREVSRLRVSAMAKSIISSLKRALCINPARTAFCSAFDKARNAVKNISALAWITVIYQPPLFYKFTTLTEGCQGRTGVTCAGILSGLAIASLAGIWQDLVSGCAGFNPLTAKPANSLTKRGDQ